MNQLTIRSQSKEREAKLKELAAARGWSLNQAANYLMSKGAGLLDEPSPVGIGARLDEFIGSWSEEEFRGFNQRIAEAFESIDEDLWK